jgi:hypothetical protein
MNANTRYLAVIALGLLVISATACAATTGPGQHASFVETRNDDRDFAHAERADRRIVTR